MTDPLHVYVCVQVNDEYKMIDECSYGNQL